MKTLIILILAVALLAAAHFTRPSRASFKDLITAKAPADENAGTSARHLKYVDHYLWVTVDRDGKPLYVGAFSHWFDVGQGKKAIRGEGTASAGAWYGDIGA